MNADAAEQRRAVAVAGHTGDVATAHAGLESVDERVRAGALSALRRLGHLTSADLRTGLGDPSPIVRRRACELAATTDVAITTQLDDSDATVVEVAAWAIGEQQPTQPGAVERLVQVATEHDEPLCRESAVASLGAIGDPAGLDAILGALGDKAPVRRRAVLALTPFDDPRITVAVTAALDDRDWQVRQAAEDLLAAD